ncbi:MAG: DUF1127 domain-containing protein [Alphaproteobacteria bacterium]|nr:DUF1127 domain-containing protein [Alphaproteobacteria bacterium]
MARNQDAGTRWDAGIPDTTDLYLTARRARDAFVAAQIARGFKAVYRTVLQPVFSHLATRRVIAEVRSLDAHILADIGIDRSALASGTLRRRELIEDLGSGPAMWPRRPSTHSVPLSDIVPGAAAANDPTGRNGQRVA